MENASAILGGKERNVHCDMTNAKCLIVMVTGTALMENVPVCEVIKANSVETLTVHIQLVRATDSVSRVLVSAKRAGKGWTAQPWIKMRYSVYQIAQGTVPSTLIHKLAVVTYDGPVTIAQKRCAI